MLREIESLRAQVAALTEDKARTDAAVNDHLARLARVERERDAARAHLDTMVAQDARQSAEVTRLRAALVDIQHLAANSIQIAESPPSEFQGVCYEALRDVLNYTGEALAPEGKAKP